VRAVSDEEKSTRAHAEERDADETEERDEERSSIAPDASKVAPDDAEGSEAARRVASALGVEGDGEAAPAKGEDEGAEGEAPAPNRAARRAEAAQRRKKRKPVAAASPVDEAEADESLPKDKNARAKELLKRRREQAQEARPIQLLPGEMVDDALARSGSAISKWIRENFTVLQWLVVGAVVAGGVYLAYESRVDKRDAGATAALMEGVTADEGRVVAEDKRTDEQKQADPTRVFKTADERADTALAAYKKTAADHAGTAPAVLAQLGEAGDYLDKQDWPHALEAYSAVASSSLAGADPDVKGRALEGLGFAKEGKGDVDGALATFKELEAIDARGFKELGLYHQGRLWLAKGDKEKAKDFLKQAHDKLESSTSDAHSFKYLQQMTDDALRRIDPALVTPKTPAGGGAKGGGHSQEEIEKIQKQLIEQLKQKDPH